MAGQKGRSGGRRPGAGRLSSREAYGAESVRVRVPATWVPVLEQEKRRLRRQRRAGDAIGDEVVPLGRPAEDPSRLRVPLYQSRVQAGFPSPAEDFIEGRLDFNELLVKRPAATFCVRVTGASMTGAGIFPDDILVVDRSIEPERSFGKVVIAVIDGQMTVKRLIRQGERVLLQPDNPRFESIELNGDMDAIIWGVVTGLVRNTL